MQTLKRAAAACMAALLLSSPSPLDAAPAPSGAPRSAQGPASSPSGAPRSTPGPASSPSPSPTPAPSNGSYTPTVEDLPVPPPISLPPPTFVPASVTESPLTLQEAVHIALVNQPNLTVALAGVLAAQARTQQVRAATLPSIAVNASAANQVTSSGLGFGGAAAIGGAGASPGVSTSTASAVTTSGATVGGAGVTTAATSAALGTGGGGGSAAALGFNFNGYQITTSLRQLIFDFNHTRQLLRQSLSQERSAFANLSQVQQTLVFQVKQGFFQQVQNLRLVKVQEANLKNQQEHLRLAQARYRAGLGLPSDVVRAQTAVASAIFNLNQAQNTASISRVNLALLMGIDPRTPVEVHTEGQSEPPIDTSDPDLLFRTALEQRPDMLAAIANLQSSQYALAAAKTNNAPVLAGTATYFARGNTPTLFDFYNFNVGLQLTWSLFDGGLTRARVKEARANELNTQAQLLAARQNALSDVAQAYLNLKTSEQRLVTAGSEVANAQETVRLITGRYRAGLGTFLDVLDAEQALVTAETNQVNAQSAVDQARAAMFRALGMPLPDVPNAGTAVPPPPALKIPAPPTENRGASPIPVHPAPPSNAPGAPAARGASKAPPSPVTAPAEPPSAPPSASPSP